MYGWTGSILYVDLARGKIQKRSLPESMKTRFVGGRGINAKLLWDLTNPSVNPFDPENPLIFGAGCLTGTTAPASGRTTITCKSPVTSLYLKNSMGGHWGAELKFAGLDHIVVQGSSRKPVYLWICNDRVEIHECPDLWGLDVRRTDEAVKKDLGDRGIRVVCIGPAGENLVKLSGIMSSVYHTAARGGIGAVMGSKKLKAIAVRGNGQVNAKDMDALDKIVMRLLEKIGKDQLAKTLHQFGTSGLVDLVNETHAFPSYNFQTCHLEDVYTISGECLVKEGYLVRRSACFSCPIGCHRYTSISKGRYAGTSSGGPEYETCSSLGAGTGVLDTEALIKSNELCNILGLDTISTGSVIQWAMECYEKGIITKNETDGIELKFGNSEALIKIIEMIANRKGKIGNLLAEGVKRASEIVGKDSWKWAICNSKGLEQSRVDTRCAKANALAFAVNPRGPDHLHANPVAEYGMGDEATALIAKLTEDEQLASPYTTQGRAEIVRWHEDCYAVAESLGLCIFTCISTQAIKPQDMAEMFSAATGVRLNEQEIMLSGRRTLTLERCYNVREGADRKMDDLPWRLMHEPAPTGPAKGATNSREELDKMLDEYYALQGWEIETGYPYDETLNMLGLKDVHRKLKRIGRVPKKTSSC